MSVDRNGFVIEIRRGNGNPRHLALSPGNTVNPMSIGMMGDWRVEADGMLDVHAFVYFDGAALFVQSVDGHNVVRVNGKPIGQDWTPVTPPCTLAIGDARLVYCPASQASAVSAPVSARPAAGRAAIGDDAPTMADVRPDDYDDAVSTKRTVAPDEEATGSIPIPGGKFVPPPAEDDNETTRALPLPDIASIGSGAPRMPPPAPPMPMASPQPIAAPPPAPVVEEKPKPLDQLKAQWKAASLPKKAIAILLPLAFVMVIFGLDDDPPPRPANKPAASASAVAKTAKSAPTQEKSAEPEDLDPVPAPTAPTPTATAKAAPTATAKASPATSAQKTAERAAVDAVAAGAWEPAAKLYEDLAKQHPDNPAYKEAARILRAKAKK